MRTVNSAIECHGLRKRFDTVVAVDGLDLDVREGECFGLLGPNGAGKTTTIEMLEGLTRPDEGSIRILGLDWNGDATRIRQKIGVSLQETKLNEKLTVAETLRLFRSFYPEGRDPDALIDELSLNEKRDARVGKLSGGQRQRLAVAVALSGDPSILFLDEPTTGLDPQSRLQLWEQVNRFRVEGRTVLLTTHYMDEAERLCDRVAIVDHGRVIALGTPAELISSLEGSKVIEIETQPLLSDDVLAAIDGVASVVHRGNARALNCDALADTVPRVLRTIEENGAKLVNLSTHNATLEDLFVSLTGRELRED
ncbi:MAG: ABC transporter ATP-binding protein [Acidobacteria bacterium]|nr:ABC transporter ATP-binding protein [Acidobacteriota bacterium]